MFDLCLSSTKYFVHLVLKGLYIFNILIEDFVVCNCQLSKRHRDGHMVRIDWLDRLTFREIEMVNEQQKRDSNHMYLMIEFPQVVFENLEYTIVYFEKVQLYLVKGPLISSTDKCTADLHKKEKIIS